MLHTCRVNVCQWGRGQIFSKNKYFVRKHIFAIDYQENTTICFLQPIILGRNYLCTNNRYIIFISSITINKTVHHFMQKPVP